MFPPTRNARPPNIFFSVTPFSVASSSRIRFARSSSYAITRYLQQLGCFRTHHDRERRRAAAPCDQVPGLEAVEHVLERERLLAADVVARDLQADTVCCRDRQRRLAADLARALADEDQRLLGGGIGREVRTCSASQPHTYRRRVDRRLARLRVDVGRAVREEPPLTASAAAV